METFAINRAFSKQAIHYDQDDRENPILHDMRDQVYQHVGRYMKPQSSILELNAGTGIDALHFVELGHPVHATDLSDGMIKAIEAKISASASPTFTCQQLSFDHLEKLKGRTFDYVFSNFGGLNCLDDLAKVTASLRDLMTPGAYCTMVVMPPVSLWELTWIFKGRIKAAFRRWHKGGTLSHLEGEHFRTYYYSVSDMVKAMGPSFKFISSQGLRVVTPPPSLPDFPRRHPTLYRFLEKIDARLRNTIPFNRWADHVIVTFRSRIC